MRAPGTGHGRREWAETVTQAAARPDACSGVRSPRPALALALIRTGVWVAMLYGVHGVELKPTDDNDLTVLG